MVSKIATGTFIDRSGHRNPVVLLTNAFRVITASLLLVRNLPDAGIFVAYYLSGTSFVVNPIIYG